MVISDYHGQKLEIYATQYTIHENTDRKENSYVGVIPYINTISKNNYTS